MIDFNRPPAQKSDEEKQFDELNEQYTEKFGESYGFYIGMSDQTWPEAIADIRKCIETGKPQNKPDYVDGLTY